MHQGKAVFRVGILGMGRGVSSVITRKAPKASDISPVRRPPQGPRGKGAICDPARLYPKLTRGASRAAVFSKRDFRVTSASPKFELAKKLTFYPAGRTEKQQTPAPRKHFPCENATSGFPAILAPKR